MPSPRLSAEERARLLEELKRARATQRRAKSLAARRAARAHVDAAKVALGERGPVWWDDGAPDYDGARVADTPYRAWHAALALVGAAGPRRWR